MTDPTKPVTKTIKNLGSVHRIPGMALQIMLLGILVPTAFYAFKLDNPTPAQLLVAICMSLFSAVIFLWILDATSILRFRSEWVSRSVYGAAIASVLGTSVAVYRDAFAERQYPLEGAWELTVLESKTSSVLADTRVVLSYSDSAATYWGYSKADAPTAPPAMKAMWVEVRHLRPSTRELSLRLLFSDGSTKLINVVLQASDAKRLFQVKTDAVEVTLSRPAT